MGEKIVLCNAHYLHFPLDDFLSSQERLGRSRISLYGSVPHLLIDHNDYLEADLLGESLKRRGFSIDAFIPAGYGYSIFAEQGTEHYSASCDYYCNCVRAAGCLGTDLLCIRPHNGVLSQDPAVLLMNCASMLKDILVVAKELKIKVALGTNLSGETAALRTMSSLKSLVSMMDDRYLGTLLDTHVMSMANETIEEWADTFGEKLFYVHLADGRQGGYRIWGEGVYPVRTYLQSLIQKGYQGSYTYLLLGNIVKAQQADVMNHQAVLAAGKEVV